MRASSEYTHVLNVNVWNLSVNEAYDVRLYEAKNMKTQN